MKRNNKISRSRMMLDFLQGSKRYFAAGVSFAAAMTILDLIGPKIVGYTVDTVIGNSMEAADGLFSVALAKLLPAAYLKEHLGVAAAAAAIVALLAAICRYYFRVLNTKGAETFVCSIREQLFRHIEHLPFAWYQANDTGDIIQRCTSDVDTVKRFVSEQLTPMIRIVVLLTLSLIFMWDVSPALTIPAALFIPLIVIYSMFFHNRISTTFEKADEEEGKLSSITQENLTGVRVVRAFGRERAEKDKFAAQNKIYTAAYLKLSILLSGFWCAGDFISGLQVLTVVALGAYHAVKGNMTAGNYIAFISFNQMLVWPVRQLGRVISEMSKAGVSIDRVRYIMESEEECDAENAIETPMDADIEFSHVSFRYEEEGKDILKDVSFTIPAGSTVGILGGTGSGKSTLMQLLDRMYTLKEGQGEIRIGGVNINQIKADYLRENIGMVMQEPFLFSRTIAENIAIASAGAKQPQIERASRIASLDEAVAHFVKGYDTIVGERGVTLSGGQKQRTAIAQMVIRETPIMIFDDSLSAVDAETDEKIRNELAGNESGATVILISHRISTLMKADKIIVLSHGEVAEEGTHASLMKQGGIYSQICAIQSAGSKRKEADQDE